MLKICSGAELKKELSKNFNNRIDPIRHPLLDSYTTLADEAVVILEYEILNEILLPENEDVYLLKPNTVFQTINETFEKEAQMILEGGEKLLKDEMDVMKHL